MGPGRGWTVYDRHGNPIYLTDERWEHIVDPFNHPEMAECETRLKDAIQIGIRKVDSLNPPKYRYTKAFPSLAEDNTHIVAVVLFGFSEDSSGQPVSNNYVVTAFQQEIR